MGGSVKLLNFKMYVFSLKILLFPVKKITIFLLKKVLMILDNEDSKLKTF